MMRRFLLMLTMPWLCVLLFSQTEGDCGAPFPRGFVPFSSVYYVTGTAGRGLLVAGVPGPGGLHEITSRLPLPSAPDQVFSCGDWIELAPGRRFARVFVPTQAERLGDFSGSLYPGGSWNPSGGLIFVLDPLFNQPFPGNVIPRSRLDELFVFRALWVSPTAPGGALTVAENGIVSATGDTGGAVAAPGALISIYGANLAAKDRKAPVSGSGRLPVMLEDVDVRIGGKPAPLLYVSPGQINAQVPFEVETGSQPVVVSRWGWTRATYSLPVTATAPAIFPGAFLKNADFSIVSEQNPARPGDVLLVYSTGLGAVRPGVTSGPLAPATPLSFTVETPRVTIGGIEAQVLYALLSPGFVGLYQIAVVAPDRLPPATATVVVTAGTTASAPKDLTTAGGPTPPGG